MDAGDMPEHNESFLDSLSTLMMEEDFRLKVIYSTYEKERLCLPWPP